MPHVVRQRAFSKRWRVLFATICILLFLDVRSSSGQIVPLYDVIYRPPGVGYLILPGDHFDIIYQWGHRSLAEEMLSSLETSLAGTDSLIGVRAGMHMPVLLNGYSDRAGGFASTLPFKQEISTVSVKGRGLSRRHPDWISVVGPHEVVHSAQAEYSDGAGIVGLVRFFAPDAARSLNLFVPPGIAEGLAVYRESRLTEGAGRLNSAFFNMLYRASFEKGKGWSLAQMLERPRYTTPFDRFYPGGAHLVKYMKESYSSNVVQRLLTWQYRIPFPAYGINLLYATHQWPWKIQKNVRTFYKNREVKRIRALGPLSYAAALSSSNGLIHRRPRWLDSRTILVFAVGYNVRRGFYRYDVDTGRRETIANTTISDDAFFVLNLDSTQILYSRYVEDAFVPGQKIADAYAVSLDDGKMTQTSRHSHVLNPVQLPDGRTLALRNKGQFNSIVEIDARGLVDIIMEFPRSDFVSLIPRPGSDSLAIILKAGTHQALFLVDSRNLSTESLRPWIGFDNATIYDAAWSSDGRFLTFTADMEGVLNVYAVRAADNKIWRVTNVKYAAMEGGFSPSNSRIAYVEYHDQRFDLKIITFRPDEDQALDPEIARFTSTIPWREWLGEKRRTWSHLPVRPYNAFRNVSLRMLYPTLYLENFSSNKNDATLGTGVGLALQFADPLQEWTYYAEGIVQKSNFWGEIGGAWAGFILRPSVSASSRPKTVDALIIEEGEVLEQRVIRHRKEVSFGIELPITITDNVYRTSFNSALSLNMRRDKFLDDALSPLAPERRRLTLSHGWSYRWRVQRNRRDLFPNSGVVLRGFGDLDLATTEVDSENAIVGLADIYVPLLTRSNTGIRLNGGVLDQNSPSVFNLDFFKPRGREDIFLPAGRFARFSAEVRHPVLFVDDGLTLLPIFLQVFYVYGFADHVRSIDEGTADYSSLGAGAGVQFRLFHFFNIDLKGELAYFPEDGAWRGRGWVDSVAY